MIDGSSKKESKCQSAPPHEHGPLKCSKYTNNCSFVFSKLHVKAGMGPCSLVVALWSSKSLLLSHGLCLTPKKSFGDHLRQHLPYYRLYVPRTLGIALRMMGRMFGCYDRILFTSVVFSDVVKGV